MSNDDAIQIGCLAGKDLCPQFNAEISKGADLLKAIG